MASPALTAYDAYVDYRRGNASDHAELKAKGEELFTAVFHEMVSLVDVEGDKDVGDPARETRQAVFKVWWAEMRSINSAVQLRLEPAKVD